MQILTRSHDNTNMHGNDWMRWFVLSAFARRTCYISRKEGRREPEGERERRKEGERGRKRERRNSYWERGRKRSTQYALKLTTVSSLELIQESVSCYLSRPLLTTLYVVFHFFLPLLLSFCLLCSFSSLYFPSLLTNTFLLNDKRMSFYLHLLTHNTLDPIYQPLRSGRIWHKVNFASGV